MTYLALYRRWRPKVFEDVIGQEHITKTLKNQIKNNGIAHAYLFCGTRGTGKTSTAKIFAKAVNCLNPENYNPCNKCEICKGIQNESIMDVLEIDAASNNGVDNIRELKENVKYPPTKGSYKVYIIDEVHMLSTGAFNALLKTLEEPPSFVVFILATTEFHKIPATILSRCQRFDFKRVKEKDIIHSLDAICQQLEVEAEEEALMLIARNADGSMRDAISMLDQCISYKSDGITHEDVVSVMGIVTDEFLYVIVDHIIEGNSRNAMELIEEMVQSGKDIHQFIKGLINHYRDLMMTKVADQQEGVIHLSKESIQRLRNQGLKTDINHVMRAIKVLSETDADAKWSSQPRVLLEVAIIKLIQPLYDYSMEGLVQRVVALEKEITTGIPRSKSVEVDVPTVKAKPIEEKKPLKPQTIEKDIEEPLLVSGKSIPLDKIKTSWESILREIKKRKISVYAWVMEGKPTAVENQTITIAFEDRFALHKEASDKSPNKNFIEDIISEIIGAKVNIKCVMMDEVKDQMAISSEIEVFEEELEIKKLAELLGKDVMEIIE